jgi:hypothetical protein
MPRQFYQVALSETSLAQCKKKLNNEGLAAFDFRKAAQPKTQAASRKAAQAARLGVAKATFGEIRLQTRGVWKTEGGHLWFFFFFFSSNFN